MRYCLRLLLLAFTAVLTAPASGEGLIFSEYLEGSSNNKAIEIYNSGATTVDLDGWSVKRYNNGSLDLADEILLNTIAEELAAGEVLTIGNPSATADILDVSDTLSTIAFFNGDDALTLVNEAVVVDMIGVVGQDPGTNWAVGAGATSEFTLQRSENVCEGNPTGFTGPAFAGEWVVQPQNTSSGLGSHTADCIPPAPTLIFSEYIEGMGDNKALEVFNATNAAVELAGWFIRRFNRRGSEGEGEGEGEGRGRRRG
jgi:predicted extracellular nuclease